MKTTDRLTANTLAARATTTLALVSAAMFAVSSAAAGATCALCDTEVVMNADLAACFLEKYDALAKASDPTIVVDLTDCNSRGIVDALPSLDTTQDAPDTEFMLSRGQLDCLKQKLADPDIELDPTATIDLSSCS